MIQKRLWQKIKNNKKINTKRFKVGLLIILLPLVLLFTGIKISQQPFVCRLCHVVRPEYEAWKVGPHKNVSCVKCHIGLGVFGFLNYIVDASVGVYGAITQNFEKPIKSWGPDRSCLQCHQVLKKTLTARGIRVSHKEINAAGFECGDCHSATGHPQATTLGKKPNMLSCSKQRCHNGQNASADCELCHVKPSLKKFTFKLAPREHQIKIEIGTIKTPKLCYTCHSKESFCTACHGLELPHSEFFLANHFGELRTLGATLCQKCHSNNTTKLEGCYEGECHQVEPRSFETLGGE